MVREAFRRADGLLYDRLELGVLLLVGMSNADPQQGGQYRAANYGTCSPESAGPGDGASYACASG